MRWERAHQVVRIVDARLDRKGPTVFLFEVFDRIHAIDLIANRRLEVDRWIDFASGRRVGLAIGAQRNELELVLKLVHGFVVGRCAVAINAAKQPDDGGSPP